MLQVEASLPMCIGLAGLGGLLEVLATAVLAYPAARIAQGIPGWTDRLLKACLALNIILQVLASLAGNLFSTWFGPVSISGPMFLAAQLLANLAVFWVWLGIEAFSKEMHIGTYNIAIAVILLVVNGPALQDYKSNNTTFDDLIHTPHAMIWSLLLLGGMLISGMILLLSGRLQISPVTPFESRPISYKMAVLLIARSTAFSLNLSTGKALILETSPSWLGINIAIKIISGAIYTMAIVVQSTAVPQNLFVPINAVTAVFINAISGMLIWEDWRVVQSWTGYACVFLLLALGCILLLGDLGLLNETQPATFRGAQLGMTLRRNREQLIQNIRLFGSQRSSDQRHDNVDVEGQGTDVEKNTDEAAPSAIAKQSDIARQAWSAIYENTRAVPPHSISSRTMRYRNTGKSQLDYEKSQSIHVMGTQQRGIPRFNQNYQQTISERRTDSATSLDLASKNRTLGLPPQMKDSDARKSKSETPVDRTTEKMSTQPEDGIDAPLVNHHTNSISNSKEEAIQVAPPTDFKFEKNVCALSWWLPIRLLEEGSISDIHLVKRRDKFVKVKYKDKRDVMELAKKAPFFWSRSSFSWKQERYDEDLRVLKSIMKDHIGDDAVLDEMRSEIIVMSHLKHPNIVTLYEAYERRRHIYLVMEFCPGGNLTNRTFTEEQSRSIIQKVLSAVSYMHSKGVAHRDIKLENIMLDRHGEIKIIDFGLATKYLSNEHSNMTDTVGTLYSMAPQVIEGKEYDWKCDLWSIGVVTYLLLSNMQPFWGPLRPMPWAQRREIMMRLITACEYEPMDGRPWEGKSANSKEFVRSLLQYNPDDRPTAEDALSSRFIKQGEYEWTRKAGFSDTSKHSATKRLDLQNEKNVNLTAFRRKAWRLLAHKLSQDEAESLQTKLEEADTEGKGSVEVQEFLSLLVRTTSLSPDDLEQLQLDFITEENTNGNQTRLSYIDFMIEVHAGRRRNILENVAALLDSLDTAGNRVVQAEQLCSRLTTIELMPQSLREELFDKVKSMQNEDGNVSTVRVLEWLGKHIARQQRESIRSLPE